MVLPSSYRQSGPAIGWFAFAMALALVALLSIAPSAQAQDQDRHPSKKPRRLGRGFVQ
jgi:hypothetical protein